MTDPVNSPSHYNQNGIEVIDVIETYAKHDFRLANVLKYVCRAGYKGHPLQDLQKAQWYLNRVVNEMEELDRDIQLLEERLSDDTEKAVAVPVTEWVNKSGYSTRDVDVFFEGYECRKQEEAEELYQLKPGDKGYTEEPESLSFHPTPNRIAGDDAAATRAKDKYYGFDPLVTKTYCVQCDKAIANGQPHITLHEFAANGVLDLPFCGYPCSTEYRESR